MDNKKALYAGTFDPFTNGHFYIAKQSAKLFNELTICIAHNSNKKRSSDTYKMKCAIEELFKNYDNVSVVIVSELIADYCAKNDINYLVRGIRNTSDYLYEENIAKINNEINPSLQTIYFRADNDVISSSMVRELKNYGKDVSKYLPEEISKIY